MQYKILKPVDFQTMPWKNGGGSTTELIRDPAEGDFSFRLSIANIDQSGPFSQFPGYNRIILQLSGAGIELVHPESSVVLELFEPYFFTGERQTFANLGSSPAMDFNVIYCERGEVAECTVLSGKRLELGFLGQLLYVYSFKGATECGHKADTLATVPEGCLAVIGPLERPLFLNALHSNAIAVTRTKKPGTS